MNNDYGLRAKRRPSRQEVIAKWGGIAVCVAIAFGIVAAGRARRMAGAAADAPYWTVSGAACPAVAALPPSSPAPTTAFDYGDVVFARAYGHASCALIEDPWSFGLSSHAICQFTSPFTLKITTDKGNFRFLTGSGQPASVSIKNGVPSCVLNANFR